MVFLSQCSSIPEAPVQPSVSAPVKSSAPSGPCAAISAFFSGPGIRSTDLASLRRSTQELLKNLGTVPADRCPDRIRLERLNRILDLRFPADPKALEAINGAENLQSQIVDKSDGFRWRLPGQKIGTTRSAFLKLLATTPERSKRESLYKLFSSSRSRKWSSWGFRDLIRRRNQEARSVSGGEYLNYAMGRGGVSFEFIEEAAQRIREAIPTRVARGLKAIGSRSGFQSPEPWDLPWLLDHAWGPTLQSGLKASDPKQGLEFANRFLHSVGLDFEAVAGTADLKELQLGNDPPLVRSDFGALVGSLVVETYYNEVRQPIPLFQRPSETAEESIFQAFRFLTLESSALALELKRLVPMKDWVKEGLDAIGSRPAASPESGMFALTLQANHYAALFEFEKALYRQPNSDPAEIWVAIQKEFWGVEVPPFYSAWDEDLILKSPGASGEKLLGVLVAAGLIDSIHKNFPAGLTSDLGKRLKSEWFPVGSESPTLVLLERFTGNRYSVDDLVGLLK